MITRRVIAVLAGLVVVAGCTPGPGGADQDEPPLDPAVMAMAPRAVDPRQTSFPLDAYERNQSLGVIGYAVDIVQQRCFRRFGLDLPLPDRGDGVQSPLPTWDWYGLWDASGARQYGYEDPPRYVNSFMMSVGRAGPEWDVVLGGVEETFNGVEVPEGGCQGESFRAVGLDQDGGHIDVPGLYREAITLARQHSAVEALIDDWSDCLADLGWEAADPSEPFRRWQGRRIGPAGGPSSDEIAMAMADIECKKETGLLRAWVAAEVAYQNVLADEHVDALRDLAAQQDQMRRKAADIVAGDG